MESRDQSKIPMHDDALFYLFFFFFFSKIKTTASVLKQDPNT